MLRGNIDREGSGVVMKQYELIYTDFDELKSFVYKHQIGNNTNVLIQIFTGIVEQSFIKKISSEIEGLVPQGKMIGTTTGGEIFEGGTLEYTTIISFTVFQSTTLESRLLICEDNEFEAGAQLINELVHENTKVIIVFMDGLKSNSDKVLEGIQSTNSPIIISGGRAGENGYFNETFVFTQEGITDSGIVAVALTGTELQVTTDYSFGWTTIGRPMEVTHAEDNRIYTIEGMKTVDVYRKYLGEQVAGELPTAATEFPLIVNQDGVNMAKVAKTRNEDDSLSYLSNVSTGDKVQFAYGNVDLLLENSLNITHKLEDMGIGALFIYSCCVRKSFMQKNVELEIIPLNSVAPTVGFFTYGEFFTFDVSKKLLNVSMTILGLSEGEQYNYPFSLQDEEEVSTNKSFLVGKELVVIKALSHLSKQATNELHAANRILEEEKNKIEKMSMITQSILQMNIGMVSEDGFDKFIQTILEQILDLFSNIKIGSILIYDKNYFTYKATKGYASSDIKKLKYKRSEILYFSEKADSDFFNPTIYRDLENSMFRNVEKYNKWREMIGVEPFELLSCAIRIENHIDGYIHLLNLDETKPFDEEDKKVLKYLCYDVAIAIKNLRLFQDIIYMSKYDSLTKAYNRNYFSEIFEENFYMAQALDKSLVVCMIDINNLKIINDNFGHSAGDKLLNEFVTVFNKEIHGSGILGRMGGDEFTCIFMDMNRTEVINIMNSIYSEFKKTPLSFGDNLYEISFAYGLSEYGIDEQDIEGLMKIADRRMYTEKRRMKDMQGLEALIKKTEQ